MAACAGSDRVLPRSLTEVMAVRRPPPETWGISDPGSRSVCRGAKARRRCVCLGTKDGGL